MTSCILGFWASHCLPLHHDDIILIPGEGDRETEGGNRRAETQFENPTCGSAHSTAIIILQEIFHFSSCIFSPSVSLSFSVLSRCGVSSWTFTPHLRDLQSSVQADMITWQSRDTWLISLNSTIITTLHFVIYLYFYTTSLLIFLLQSYFFPTDFLTYYSAGSQPE